MTLDRDTGILTVTLANGTQQVTDLDIEKVVTNFDLDEDNNLVTYFGRWNRKEGTAF